MGGYPWTAPELEHLEQLAGDHPMAEVATRYNRWAKANGLPSRTLPALGQAGYNRGVTFRPYGAMVTHQALCTYLGLTKGQAAKLLDQASCRQLRPRGRRYVTRKELRRLARQHPQWFAGATTANLVQLLEDEKLAEWCKQHQPIRYGRNCSPVRCIETGLVYPSVMAAAAAVFVTRHWLHYSLRTGCRAGGFHWQYLNDSDRQSDRRAG